MAQDDTDECLKAMQGGHKCKDESAVIETLRGFLGLSGSPRHIAQCSAPLPGIGRAVM